MRKKSGNSHSSKPRQGGVFSLDRESLVILLFDKYVSLAERNYVHLHIKPGNVFLNLPDIDLRFADNGGLLNLNNERIFVPSIPTTPRYSAPELWIKRDDENGRRHSDTDGATTLLDLYSLGMTMFDLICNGCNLNDISQTLARLKTFKKSRNLPATHHENFEILIGLIEQAVLRDTGEDFFSYLPRHRDRFDRLRKGYLAKLISIDELTEQSPFEIKIKG